MTTLNKPVRRQSGVPVRLHSARQRRSCSCPSASTTPGVGSIASAPSFPARNFQPNLVFKSQRKGPWARFGEAGRGTNTITLWTKGMNLETLLHEFAHLLSPRSGHNKDFYATCDLLIEELFPIHGPVQAE